MNKIKASAAFETFIVPRINRGLREAAFWVLAGLSLILLLALLSYNKADPAFTVAGGDEAVTNRMGPAGAWLAPWRFSTYRLSDSLTSGRRLRFRKARKAGRRGLGSESGSRAS